MACCTRCTSCDDCNGSCNDTCNACNACNQECDTLQAYCLVSQTASDYVGGFSWPSTCASEETIAFIWTAAKWNELAGRIRDAYAYTNFDEVSPGSMTTVASDDIISAALYNQIASNIRNFGGGTNTLSLDDVIWGDRATELSAGFNTMELPNNYCEKCNTACDAECDACNGCDSCNSCNYCEGCNRCTNCNTCESCDTCETTVSPG